VCEVWQTELAFHGYLEHRLLPVIGRWISGAPDHARAVTQPVRRRSDVIDRSARSLPGLSWAS
jgi:hypothetical protein